jgi:hypothetical protein
LFYGLPDGKVYIIYARFFEIKFQRSGLEFILAEHLEFSYNYAEEKLFSTGNQDTKKAVYAELVDMLVTEIDSFELSESERIDLEEKDDKFKKELEENFLLLKKRIES